MAKKTRIGIRDICEENPHGKLYIEKAFGSSIVNRELGIEPVHVH